MTKTVLIKLVSKETGVSANDTRKVINSMIEMIKAKLLYGVNVKLKDFITFELRIAPELKRKNPQTGKEMIVPKKYKVKTILSKVFTDKLKDKTVY